MSKIEVIYDPDNGLVVPDNKVERVVEEFINNTKELEGIYPITVGSELTVDYFRLAVKQEKIGCDDIVFLFNGNNIPINKDGRLSRWPTGFCDHLTDVLSKLCKSK